MEHLDYMTIKELSQYLKLPEETIYKFARAGKVPASKVGRYWRFERAAIDRWVLEHGNMTQDAIKVLVVDDEESLRMLLGRWLMGLGCVVDEVSCGEEAVALLQERSYDVAFLDLLMPGISGVEVLAELRKFAPKTLPVIVTAYFESRLMEQALDHGALTIIKKPVRRESVVGVIDSMRMAIR